MCVCVCSCVCVVCVSDLGTGVSLEKTFVFCTSGSEHLPNLTAKVNQNPYKLVPHGANLHTWAHCPAP